MLNNCLESGISYVKDSPVLGIGTGEVGTDMVGFGTSTDGATGMCSPTFISKFPTGADSAAI